MNQQELLKNHYLFAGATSNDLEALNAIVERKAYIAGDFVYGEEMPPMRCSLPK